MICNICEYIFQQVCIDLLKAVPSMIGSKNGTFTQWNDLLGWYCPSPDVISNENLSFIRKQLQCLWGTKILKILLSSKLNEMTVGYGKREMCTSIKSSGNLFKRTMEIKSKPNVTWRKMDSPEVREIAQVCQLYYIAQTNLNQLKLDILSGELEQNRCMNVILIIVIKIISQECAIMTLCYTISSY